MSDVCLMEKLHQCGVSSLGEEDDIDWVQCSACCGWYHCICVGMALELFRDQEFCCCQVSTDNTTYIIILLILSNSLCTLFVSWLQSFAGPTCPTETQKRKTGHSNEE